MRIDGARVPPDTKKMTRVVAFGDVLGSGCQGMEAVGCDENEDGLLFMVALTCVPS